MRSGLGAEKIQRVILGGFFFLPGLAILYRSWTAGVPPAGPDFFLQFIPWWYQIKSTVLSGGLPWWDGSCMMGVPVLADPQTALLYFPNWLFLVMPVEAALTILIVLHLWLAGYLMMRWVDHRTGSRETAWLAGLMVQLTAFYWIHIVGGHYTMLCAAAWMPGALGLADRYVEKASLKMFCLLAAILGIQYLSGHPQTTFFTILGAGVILTGTRGKPLERAREFLAGALVLLFLTIGPLAIQTELIQQSARQSVATRKFFSDNRLPLENLLQYMAPYILGSGTEGSYTGDGFFHETFNYLGIVPLLLVPLAFRRNNRRLWLAGAVGIFLAVMPGIPGVSDFFRELPVLGSFRSWARSTLLFNVVIIALAGDGLAFLLQRKKEQARRFTLWSVVIIVAMVLINTFAMVSGISAGDDFQDWIRLLVPFLVMVLFWILVEKNTIFWVLILAVIVLMDSGFIVIPMIDFNQSFSMDPFLELSENLDELLKNDTARIVFLREPSLLNTYFLLKRDSPIGYRPLPLGRYQNYMDLATGLSLDTPQVCVMFVKPGRLTSLAGVRYWFGPPPPAPEPLRKKGIFAKWTLYEDDTAYPRCWIAHTSEIIDSESELLSKLTDPRWNPRETVLLESPPDRPGGAPDQSSEDRVSYRRISSTDIQVTAESGSPGWLIVSESWYPGWRASIDDAPTKVFRADYLFMAIPVPSGRHSIRLYYDPGWRLPAFASSLVAMVGFLFLYFRHFHRAKTIVK